MHLLLSLRRLMIPVVALLLTATALTSALTSRPAAAADLSQFDPGNIISDQVFFNAGAMSEAEIQAFLDQKGASCTGGYCLKNYTHTMPSKGADAFCSGHESAPSERASRTIFRVAQECGINPQVLLVLLQKEQSLVTRTNATAATYSKATGFGCPDTAGCDATYNGFGNQVYHAARQFQRYANSGAYTWIKVGQVNQLRYHPNESCGTTPVRVDNKATAGLYYYTPYTPNAAALRAGYGTGDGCSSYGNRNFYQFFTDWFGSTQGITSSLVQVAGQGTVWLLSGSVRHGVPTPAELQVYTARFGNVRSVSEGYLQSFTVGSNAVRLVRDRRDDKIYLLQSDGTKHWFRSFASVNLFGYRNDESIDLSAAQIDAYATGPDVGDLFRIEQTEEVWLAEGGKRRHVWNADAYRSASTGRNGYVASMSAAGAAAIDQGPTYFRPNTLVKETAADPVYLTSPGGELLHIPSFGLASEVAATTYVIVPSGTLARHSVVGKLAPLMKCGSTTYVLGAGAAHVVTGTPPSGVTSTQVPAAACGAFPISGTTRTHPLFVQAAGQDAIFLLDGAQLHHVRSSDRLIELNGSRSVPILGWRAETVASTPRGAPELAARSYVQFAGGAEVYLGSGRTLQHVTSVEALRRSNGGVNPFVEQMPVEWKSYYTMGTPIS